MAKTASRGVNLSVYQDFSGGVNYYPSPHLVADNQSTSPTTDVDFITPNSIGTRSGYTQLGVQANTGLYGANVVGLSAYRTSALNQLIRFSWNSSGPVTQPWYSDGTAAWTLISGGSIATNNLMETVQAYPSTSASYTGGNGSLFTFNGVDPMQSYTTIAGGFIAYTPGATLLYGALFNSRLWGVDPTYKDSLKYSTKSPDATKPLDFTTNGTSSNYGVIAFTPGGGAEITGIKVFKDSLYVFTRKEIYSLVESSTVNVFTVTLVTATLGCVSFRSIEVCENDIFFLTESGVFGLGEVGTFTSVRSTGKSLAVQSVLDGLTSTTRVKAVGRYLKHRYHLFYSLGGTVNDSCLVYDLRYNAWQDWRNTPADVACIYLDANNKSRLFFADNVSGSGKTYELYNGTTNDGTAISAVWNSKSFDMGLPDSLKVYLNTDFVFGSLSGTIAVATVFNDNGSDPKNSTANVSGITTFVPYRLKSKAQKYAIKYNISGTGIWRLDSVTQTSLNLPSWKIPLAQKLN
ncbi:MAG: hypothetical protein ACYDBV_08590 [Nitrospiria bacterium]